MSSLHASPLNLEASGVTVTYVNGHTALTDASFRLSGGTICALVGVNGSGKSTLFKALMGFVAPTRRTITLNSAPVHPAQKKTTEGIRAFRRFGSDDPNAVKPKRLITRG